MNVNTIKKISKTRYLHQSAKLSTKENHLAKLILTTQNGSWQVNQELIAFLSVERFGETVILLDMYDNPVRVNRQHMFNLASDLYETVMNDWYRTVNTINNQR